MRKQLLTLCSRTFLAITVILLSASMALQAADKKPSLSPQTYQALKSTQEMLDAGNSAPAIRRLEKLVKETAKHPYEQAISLQSLAHAYIDSGNYAAAIPHLKQSIALQALPEEAQQRSRYNLAQLYMATEQFSPAAKLLEPWLQHAAAPSADAYVMLGSAYLQLKQYKQAVPPLRKAIDLSTQANESWYQSLLGAYNELKDYKQCVKLLHSMLKLFPDQATYWRQLSGMELMRHNTAQALAVMELAYLRGHLSTERDLLNLAQLYALRNAPYKAAQLIEDEIAKGRISATAKIWEQAANAWYQAKEMRHSISALEKAVEKNNNPDLSLRLAQLYLESQRWSDAQQRLRTILSAHDSNTQDKAWLLLGIASYEDDSMEQAKSAFSEAAKFKKTKKDAEQWLAYLARRE